MSAAASIPKRTARDETDVARGREENGGRKKKGAEEREIKREREREKEIYRRGRGRERHKLRVPRAERERLTCAMAVESVENESR